jgi:hypothetical protein
MRLTESRRGDAPHSGAVAPRRPRSHRRHPDRARWLPSRDLAVAAAAALVAIGAVVVVRAISDGSTSDGSTSDGSVSDKAASSAGIGPAETRQLTRWLAGNARAGTRVVVPPSLVDAVHAAAPRLAVQPYDAAPPAASALLVLTGPPPAPARALAAKAFPLARVAGGSGLEVRQISSESGTTAVAGEMRQLAVAGTQLAQNPRLDVPSDDRSALRAGAVDARLLVTLAALAAQHDLTVDLVTDPAAAPRSVGYREARVTAVDGTTVAQDAQVAAPFRSFIRAQPTPFTPAESGVRDTGAASAFVLRYAVPIPLGLLDSGEIPTIGP